MPQKYCHQIGEWVEDNVSQQVQQCVKKKCKWWCACCNKWFCFLVWVVVTVLKWVITTVCEILGDAYDLVVAVITGGWDIIAGIFTWDWSRVWDGFLDILGALGGLVGDLIRTVVFPCGLYGAFRDSVNKWRLIDYVEDLIDKSRRFTEADRADIKAALGISGSGFGLRLTLTSYRGYVRSDYIAPGETVPALVQWNNDPDPNRRVDLKKLAGFQWDDFWQRSSPDIRGDVSSESDIDEYLGTPSSKSFSIYAMSDSALLDRIHNIQIKGDTIGLKLVVDLQDVHLTERTQVQATITDPDGQHNSCAVLDVLARNPFNREPSVPGFGCHPADPQDPAAVERARNLLCKPVIFGTFRFVANDSYTGYAACMFTNTCLDGGSFGNDGGTGALYRHGLPNWARTWVPIHELGHTFGLCHVDGLNRIMVNPKDHSWWSGWLIPEYLCFSGEPQFSHDEARRVWDYIIASFPIDCLANRHVVVT